MLIVITILYFLSISIFLGAFVAPMLVYFFKKHPLYASKEMKGNFFIMKNFLFENKEKIVYNKKEKSYAIYLDFPKLVAQFFSNSKNFTFSFYHTFGGGDDYYFNQKVYNLSFWQYLELKHILKNLKKFSEVSYKDIKISQEMAQDIAMRLRSNYTRYNKTENIGNGEVIMGRYAIQGIQMPRFING